MSRPWGPSRVFQLGWPLLRTGIPSGYIPDICAKQIVLTKVTPGSGSVCLYSANTNDYNGHTEHRQEEKT